MNRQTNVKNQIQLSNDDLQKYDVFNYGTEVATTYVNVNSLKWPLKKLSEKIPNKKTKLACKTSVDLLNSKKFKESSYKLLLKSEAFTESNLKSANDHDSEGDSDLSCSSVEDPIDNNKAKSKFDELINRYYMCSSENVEGNYDTYITNCLKLIGYFKGVEYFEKKIKEIKDSIQSLYGNLSLSSSKPLMILDLDETLIHSDLDLKWSAHDYYLNTTDESVIPINIRPHLYDFLDFSVEYFDIIIFTASCSDYADPIIDFIEKEKKYFKYRFYREHCINYGNFYIKDLTLFGKDLDKVIIVDNNIFSFAHYLQNGILISSFYNETEDIDLLSLIQFFKQSIITSIDVRQDIESTFEFFKICVSLKNFKK